MLQLNLLPDVKKELIRAQQQRNLVVSVAVFICIGAGVLVAILLGAIGTLNIQAGGLEKQITDNEKILNDQVNDPVLDLNGYLMIQNQLTQLDGLKSSQPAFSRLLDYLSTLNPGLNEADINNVELSSVLVTADPTTGNTVVRLQGKTTDYPAFDVYQTTLMNAKMTYSTITYEAEPNDSGEGVTRVKKYGDSLTVPLIDAINIESAGLSQQADPNGRNLSFTLSVTFNMEAFKMSNVFPVREGTMPGQPGQLDKECTAEAPCDFIPRVAIPSLTTSDSGSNAPGSTERKNAFGTTEPTDATQTTDPTTGAGQ
jgi:hypothetical protein